jgi:O-antigen ligase
MPDTQIRPALPSDASFARGLVLLLPAATWLFLPQLAGPFEAKRYVAGLGLLFITLRFSIERASTPWKLPRGVIGVALMLFLCAVVLSTATAENRYLAAVQLAQLVPLLALLLCLLNLSDADAAQRRIENALLIAAAGVALFGVKQWLLPDLFDPGFYALGKMRIYSTLGNANLAAFVLLAALPLAWLRARAARGVRRVLYAALIALLLACVVVTRSRQALLALALLVPIGVAWLGSPVRWRLATVTLVLVPALAVAAYVVGALPADFIHTAKGRVLIWLCALHMLAQHPFTGVGLGHFELHHVPAQAALFATGQFDAFMDNATAARDAHNDLLHWGATSGPAGGAAFAALCAAALWHGWRSLRLRVRCAGLYLSLIGCLCMMLFSAVLPHPATALIFWLLLGLVLRQCTLPALACRIPRFTRLAITAALSAMLLGGAVWSYRQLRAQLDEARADRLMEQHDLWLAERMYRAALTWSRADGTRLQHHATTLFLSDQGGEALAELAQAARYSGDIGIPILRAEILTRLGEYDQAVPIYRALIAAFPKMLTPRFVLAQIYAQRGEYALAEAEFRTIVDINPAPFNLYTTREKVDLQKSIARRYLLDRSKAAP